MEREREPNKLRAYVGLKGMKAREKRFVRIESASDPLLSGVYEVTSSNDTYDGISAPLIMVRCDADRWNLPVGTEPDRPNLEASVTTDAAVANIALGDMSIASEFVSGGSSGSVRLNAVFSISRDDYIVEIEHRLKGTTTWIDFTAIQVENGFAKSGEVAANQVQEVRWRTFSTSGGVSDWQSGSDVTATPDTIAPTSLSNTNVTFGSGEAKVSFTSSTSANYGSTRIYRASSSTTFADADAVRTEFGFPNASDSWIDANLSAGSYSYWLEPLNKSGVAGARVGPITGTVT